MAEAVIGFVALSGIWLYFQGGTSTGPFYRADYLEGLKAILTAPLMIGFVFIAFGLFLMVAQNLMTTGPILLAIGIGVWIITERNKE